MVITKLYSLLIIRKEELQEDLGHPTEPSPRDRAETMVMAWSWLLVRRVEDLQEILHTRRVHRELIAT